MGSTPHPSKKSCHAALCSSIRSFKWSTAAKLKRSPCPPTSSSESLRHCWVWSAFHNETACLVVSPRRIHTSLLRLGNTAAGTSQGRTSCSPRLRARRTKSLKYAHIILVPSTPFSLAPFRSASFTSFWKSGGVQEGSLCAGCSEYLPPYSPSTSLNSGSSNSAHTSGSLERWK